LRKNLSRFEASRSHVVEAALSDADGEVLLNIDTANRGASSLHGKPDGGGSVAVHALSADGLLADFRNVDIMKIDVEGHEQHVLRSAAGQVDRLQPRVILFEDRGPGASPTGAIGSVLGPLGFVVYGIKKTLTATSLVVVRSPADCVVNDYLAVSGRYAIPPELAVKYSILKDGS
jgi:FkbM family methyltransferase